jgi:CRP/FNR family transcriptional regulator
MSAPSAPIAALEILPYFRVLNETELDQLARQLIERTYDRGAIIFLEGEACEGLFIVREGSVRIYKTSSEGREQILHTMGPGGSFNEVAVFDGGPNPANVAALEPTRLWIVPRNAITGLIMSKPEVAISIIQTQGSHLRHLIGLVEDLSLRNVSARLAKLLLLIASGKEKMMTQQDMASRLGTVRETIGRSLKQMEARGLIRIERGKIVILKKEELEKMV